MAEAPLSAEEVAHRGFPSTFRGFDPAEVRAYLIRVSNELKAAAARERELKQKLIEAERRAANPVIDQAMLTRALGEETSRVLVSAQEAARQLQTRAEEAVARILREAHEQAQRIRAEAEVVLADRTEEADTVAGEIRAVAQAEAAAVVEQGRREAEAARAEVAEQSRQLVHEAQAARARVLGDLTRRRRIAHTQVEQLRAGRERLLDAYRVVRRTLDEVADELERVESEARTAAGAAARRVEAALAAGNIPGGEDDGGDPEVEAGALREEPRADVGSVTSAGPAGTAKPAAPVAPIVPAPAPSTMAAGPPGKGLTSPAEVVKLGAAPSSSRSTPHPGEAPVVAKEERVEERKLSSLRILRRPKPNAPSIPELKVMEAPSEVEGVRVIPVPAEGDERPPAPAPSSGVPEQPTLVPGISWVPAPPASPPPAAATPAPAAPPLSQTEPLDAEPVEPAAGAREEAVPPAVEDPSPLAPEQASQVEALFARIRADRAGALAAPDQEAVPPAPPATAESGDEEAVVPAGAEPRSDAEPSDDPVAAEPAAPSAGEEETLLQRRDEAIESIEAALARKLKRALQDDHNDVLDRLRSCKGMPSVSAFLPSGADQAARYESAVGDLLAEAARSGARFIASDEPGSEPVPPEVADVVADLVDSLVGPLRRDLERRVESGHDDASVLVDVIGAAYRECKTQRLEHLAADATIAAFSRGTLSASSGSELRWIVDDGDAACPDCDDNALAGPTTSGQHYPTGQPHPPAHAGCRCLLVPGHP